MTLKGLIIDNVYLKALPSYNDKDPITQVMLAQEASTRMADTQKDALDLVNAFKQEYGDGESTLILIYNASGTPLLYNNHGDDHGHIGKYPYDPKIDNGQWSCILHVHTTGAAVGSEGWVNYRIDDGIDGELYYVVHWSTPYIGSNTANAYITDKNGNSNVNRGYSATYSIGGGNSPQMISVLNYIPNPGP